MSVVRLNFVKLSVANLDPMIAFYASAFDMTVHFHVDEVDFEEVLLRQEGHDFLLGLLRWKNDRRIDVRPGVDVVGFVTQDIDGAVAKAIAAGATLKHAPFDIPGSRVALVHDIEGREIEFVQFL